MPILLFFTFYPLSIKASSQPAIFNEWDKYSTEKLLDIGLKYVNSPEKADSALLVLTIIVNRFDKDQPVKEKINIAKAYTYNAYVYIFRYYNYAKAYESLCNAQNIVKDTDEDLSSIYLYMGHIFSSIGSQSGDRKSINKAFGYLRKAFNVSLKNGEHSKMNLSFGNAISLAWQLNCIDSIADEWNAIRNMHVNDSVEFTQFNIIYYQAIKSLEKGQYKNALGYFDKQIEIMPINNSHIRYICLAHFNKAKVYAMLNEYAKAIDNLEKCLYYGHLFNLKDVNLEANKLAAEYYKACGNHDAMMKYLNNYYSLKDSLIGFQQIASIKEMSFMETLRAVNEKIEANKRSRQRLETMAIILLCVTLTISLFFIILYNKNKQLKMSYLLLYRKNQDILKLENKNKSLNGNEKYKNSTLDNEEKKLLIEKIEHILSDNQAIFSPNFSLGQLSQLVGANYKKVSQVINETMQSNFNTLLNEYRIREACKRMNDDPHYANLTIEAIAESVGFKSRSTFLQAFKRFTGLTPSNYIRIKKHENGS